MKFGCSTLLFGGYDLDTAIEGMRQAGYEAIELCSIPGMGEHFKGGEAPEVYAGIKEKLAAAGLVLDAVGGSGALGTDRFELLMEAAAVLGAPYMTLGTGGVSDDEASWQQMIASTRAALPICERTGVKLSIKPHVRAAVYSTGTATRFMEELQSPLVGLNLDNTHLQRAGDDPLTAVEMLKPWIFTARICDFRSDDLSIGPLENQIPGKGIADVKGYLRALERVAGLQTVVVEMVGAKDLELEEVRRVIGETLTALRNYAS